ncbi:hypothetical protein PARHAE_02504 [Paracoccus haematequi]|uniref:Uncharacterized protein n=1 Tax=Paracoccus haematequi TaxID=2491866 RepID=A0A3S4ESB4_9RHOB|nr:hypothetical protein [Paracoccus haematequi]VDS09009.1 hypothetical protein PARHAE_02198 [Paracoccus haematequi]VDS09306.1 hypothetical protein PARHAE_02504 [Paracoccus haematequi]
MAVNCHNTPGMLGETQSEFPIIDNLIKVDDPAQWAEQLAYHVEAMILTARLALDNDTSGDIMTAGRLDAVERTLNVAGALMAVVTNGTELLSRRQKAGIWRKGDAA